MRKFLPTHTFPASSPWLFPWLICLQPQWHFSMPPMHQHPSSPRAFALVHQGCIFVLRIAFQCHLFPKVFTDHSDESKPHPLNMLCPLTLFYYLIFKTLSTV